MSEGGGRFGDPIDGELQTLAAQTVGRRNLAELEGVSVNGADLVKVVLGIGRVFQVLASQPLGHAPEVNQFYVSVGGTDRAEARTQLRAKKLLKDGVMHLALLRSAGTKPIGPGDTKDYEYAVHPLFSAYFQFSHRQKRKMRLLHSDVVGLVMKPQATIKSILMRQRRNVGEPLPDQLQLFREFYG